MAARNLKTKTKPTARTARRQTIIARDNPALIDSSYTGFFLFSVVVWALVFSSYFPATMRLQAYILIALFSFVLYLFQFLLLQFYSAVTILRMTVLYASFSALLTILSAVKGPIADGQIPVIQVIFVGSYVSFSGTGSSLIVASLFTFYGTVALICAAVSAGCLEFVYRLARRFIPRTLLRRLRKTDKEIDTWSDQLSWQMFAIREWPGIAATIVLLLIYAAVYVMLLIA